MFVHVVAHEDDDLYFQSPDLMDEIRAGSAVTTIFVTAGEISGSGSTPGDRARSRQRGIMDAYAHMAGMTPVGDQSEWAASAYAINGHQIDCYQLRHTPITTMFMGLPDHQLATVDGGGTLTTVPATSAPVAQTQTYDRPGLVATLTAIFAALKPAVVRCQDPLPDPRYVADHPDHVAAAHMCTDAVVACTPRPALVQYRCYGIGALPANLCSCLTQNKQATALVYGAYDPEAQPLGYPARMRRRWPRGNQWAIRDASGHLVVAVVRRGRAIVWTQSASGWSAPVDLGNPGVDLVPAVSIGRNVGGLLEVVGRTADHRIMHCSQSGGGWSAAWGDLSSPNAGTILAPQLGCPVVAANADGRMEIFAANGGGGLSTLYQTATALGWVWSAWVDLTGADLQDGLASAVNTDGRIEVFAATTTGIAHWYQTAANGTFLSASFPAPAPSSELHAITGTDGRMRLAYRADGGYLVVMAQATPGGSWGVPGTSTLQGYGPVVLAQSPAGIAVYVSTPGGVATAVLGPSGATAAWTELDGPTESVAAVTGPGGVDVLGVNTDERVQQWTGTSWVPLP